MSNCSSAAPWRLATALAFALTMLPAAAGVQKCKDAAGKTYFSDRGCAGGERMRGAPDGGAHAIGTAADDEAIARRCLEHVRVAQGLGPADALRVDGYRVKTVAVRDVGPRRLFAIDVGFLNAVGYWAKGGRYECLLRGDNTTFQTTAYEIVP